MKIVEQLANASLNASSTEVASPNFCAMQSAYRAAHSTVTALVKIIDDILQSVDSGSIVALVGVDISVAFDTVNHAILLARLWD